MEKLIMLSQAAINLLIHNEYATSWLVMSSRFNNQDEDDDGETNKRSLQSLDSDFGVASCSGFFIDQQNLATLTVHLIYLSMNISNLVLSIVGSFGGRNLVGMIYIIRMNHQVEKRSTYPGSFPQSQLRPNVQCSPLITY